MSTSKTEIYKHFSFNDHKFGQKYFKKTKIIYKKTNTSFLFTDSPTSSGTTTTSILPHLYPPLPQQQQPNTYASTIINNQSQKNPTNSVFPPQYNTNNISSILPSTSILPPETQQNPKAKTFNPTTSQTSFEHFPTFPTNLFEQQKHFKQQNVFPQNYYNQHVFNSIQTQKQQQTTENNPNIYLNQNITTLQQQQQNVSSTFPPSSCKFKICF
ncbi:unnamed protein product [Meloidogyne enterolobii]|uniref:Uncharacterized protein n=1 Tax=Meloidogyne enterolobii TaxID=390850 RepID=A0ACB0XQZ5_MELEN